MQKFPTTPEQRAKLTTAGFVRVDGLRTRSALFGQTSRGPDGRLFTIEPKEEWLGHWDVNNGLVAIHTAGKEVWLAVHPLPEEEERLKKLAELFKELCPNGRGAFVPCADGKQLAWREILRRLANPDW